MTREEALKKAIIIVAYFEAHFAKSKEAREEAANIIEALEQEPCEELDFVQPHKKIVVNLEVCKMREATQKEREGVEQYIDSIAEPCEDTISRQAVLDMMQMRIGGKELYKAVYDMSSVTPAEKTGHWIESDIPNEKYTCSECGGACWYYDYHGKVAKSHYCPNCGAKME